VLVIVLDWATAEHEHRFAEHEGGPVLARLYARVVTPSRCSANGAEELWCRLAPPAAPPSPQRIDDIGDVDNIQDEKAV